MLVLIGDHFALTPTPLLMCGVETLMHVLCLPGSSAGPLALCTLEAQEVTTNGVYRLPHAIYYCS